MNSIPPETIARELASYIEQELLAGALEDPLEPEDDLLGSGLIDSLAVMRLVAHAEQAYALKIPPEDVRIENFETLEKLGVYLNQRQATAHS